MHLPSYFILRRIGTMYSIITFSYLQDTQESVCQSRRPCRAHGCTPLQGSGERLDAFSEDEKKILASECSSEKAVPEELRQRAKKLIEQLLRKETSGAVTDPKSFANSLEWAGDPG
jgi:hypothetical protein